MKNDYIKIRGARVNNLKNIDLDIPKNKLIAFTGLSGSGKSSLAFDTLYAEGQRRYVESLSAYARQFLGVMDKPDVDKIEGISPAISIDQKKIANNPRSTVGTITEIYDYLRLLFARVGIPHCPKCGKEISSQSAEQMKGFVLKLKPKAEIILLGPIVRGKKGEHEGILEEVRRAGFVRVRIDGIIYKLEEVIERKLDKKKRHNIEAVVDSLVIDESLDKTRLVDSIGTALKIGKGLMVISAKENGNKPRDLLFSERFACDQCGTYLPEMDPRMFSFNSPYGACPACHGLGDKLEVDPKLVIPNANLSLSEGAIFPWAHASHKVGRQSYYSSQLFDLATKYEFSLDDSVKDIPKKALDIILYGDGKFEGVVPNLERRYHETDSDYTRDEIEQYMVEKRCEECQGKRLRPEVLAITVNGFSMDKITEMPIREAGEFFLNLKLEESQEKIIKPVIKEIVSRLQFLTDVGLDYLTINRKASTLAGGEGQRVRLATQIGAKLSGVLYILDEPSIGLHPRDEDKLIETARKIQSIGNTVIMVEHDKQIIKSADWIVDIGPGAGKNGGKVVFKGNLKQLLKSNTITGKYLSGRENVEIMRQKSGSLAKKYLIIKKASENNLKNIDVKIPLERFVCVTGVSGSGKSSLVNDILAKALLKKFYRAKENPGKHEGIVGVENLNKVVLIDQSAIGRTPRSNPATYTGAFSYIRDLFSQTKEAIAKNFQVGRFSFNVKGGRCEECEGQGQKKIEMYFLPDIYVQCPECKGQRFNKETLAVELNGKNISEVLDMTVEESLEFFKNVPGLAEKLRILNSVGLGYVELGQPAPSLSGGEAQRVKLATELSKKGTGRTLYILDEPTTGLHPDDIKKLLFVLKELVSRGNTVLVIEHNLDVIKNADWIVDLGPEGGDKGGEVVSEGTPDNVAKNKRSYTGRYLKEVLK